MAVLAACASSGEPSPTVVRYGVEPSSLDITVGQTVPMTIAALSARGDTIPVGAWIRPSVHGSAQLSLFYCSRRIADGNGCSVTALTAGTGRIDFTIGNYSGCNDPPECVSRDWYADTVIVVPVIVRE
jgi:hypothetical protein